MKQHLNRILLALALGLCSSFQVRAVKTPRPDSSSQNDNNNNSNNDNDNERRLNTYNNNNQPNLSGAAPHDIPRQLSGSSNNNALKCWYCLSEESDNFFSGDRAWEEGVIMEKHFCSRVIDTHRGDQSPRSPSEKCFAFDNACYTCFFELWLRQNPDIALGKNINWANCSIVCPFSRGKHVNYFNMRELVCILAQDLGKDACLDFIENCFKKVCQSNSNGNNTFDYCETPFYNRFVSNYIMKLDF